MSEDTDDILRDIRRWLKIVGLKEAKPLLLDALSAEDDDRQRALRIVYHLTDGDHSTREIAEYVDFSRYWIMDRHTEWSNIGLVERDDSNSPYKHLIGLAEVGIDVPEIPEPAEAD